LRVGNKLIRIPTIFTAFCGRNYGEDVGPMPCRVIYVHPQGRYYTVEFHFPKGTIRESFKAEEEHVKARSDRKGHSGH